MDQIGALLALNALRFPNRDAIRMLDGRAVRYLELDRRTSRLANALIGAGLAPGDRVGIWLEDRLEYVESYFAAAKAGLVVVPVNERFKTREAKYQLERTDAKGLFFSSSVAPELAAVLAERPIPVLIGIGGAERDFSGALAFEDLIDRAAETRLVGPAEDSPLSICFTSGTTGFPKGATLTHRSLKNVARTQAIGLRLALGSVNLQVASMSFPATFGSHICSHVYVGGTTVLMGRGSGDAERLMQLVEQESVNHFYMPSPVLRDFTELCARDATSWRSLWSVLHAGSRADPQLLAAFADVVGTRYVEGWGMSEVSGGIASATSAADMLGRNEAMDFFASVGRPVPDTAVILVDENRQPLPHDGETVGELAVRSHAMMRGYWGDEAATAKAVSDGWYYTGDLGRIDPAGYIYIVDRRQDLIVSGGMNIYPAELEDVISQLPGVFECAVVARSHQRWGQTPVAVVVRTPGSTLDEAAIITAFSDTLAGYKKPSRVFFVDELPRHPTSNKMLRTVLRDMVEAAE